MSGEGQIAGGAEGESTVEGLPSESQSKQYSLAKILGIWAAAALPMGLILFVFMPFLIPRVDLNPGLLFLSLITLAQVWLGVLSYIVLRREVVPFTWEGLKERLWLNTPRDPRTGRPSKKLFLWTIPVIAFLLLWDELGVLEGLNEAWVNAFPFFAPPDYGQIQNLAGPAEGQWWLLGVLVVLILFNYLLGEELIFRGVLLPKMNGAFGRWDWIANGVLFSAYHLHLIWTLPSQIIVRDWAYPWAVKRYKSYWMSVIIHGFDAIFLVVLFPMAIMGML
jgi:membrane protease YdiL (CAAX protease family)